MAATDLYGLDSHAVRKALEFVAAHRSNIDKAQGVAASTASQVVLKEAERQRVEIIRSIELASSSTPDSVVDAAIRRRAEQVAYIRRAVEPLSADKLTGQMAAMLTSDSSIGAKMVAMEVVREQVDLRRVRDEGLNGSIAAARQLVDEARATLSAAGMSPENLGWALPDIEDAENEPRRERQEEPPPRGVEELIRAVREEGAKTQREVRKTREAVQQAAKPLWRDNVALALIVAALLVALAGLYLQDSQSPSSVEPPVERSARPDAKPPSMRDGRLAKHAEKGQQDAKADR